MMVLDRHAHTVRHHAITHLTNRRHAALPLHLRVLPLHFIGGEAAHDLRTDLGCDAGQGLHIGDLKRDDANAKLETPAT